MNDIEYLDNKIIKSQIKLNKHKRNKELYLEYKEKYPDLEFVDSYRGFYFVSKSIKDNPKSLIRLSLQGYYMSNCYIYYFLKEKDINIYSYNFLPKKNSVLDYKRATNKTYSHVAYDYDIFIKNYENEIASHITQKRKKVVLAAIDNFLIKTIKNNRLGILDGSFKKDRYESVKVFG